MANPFEGYTYCIKNNKKLNFICNSSILEYNGYNTIIGPPIATETESSDELLNRGINGFYELDESEITVIMDDYDEIISTIKRFCKLPEIIEIIDLKKSYLEDKILNEIILTSPIPFYQYFDERYLNFNPEQKKVVDAICRNLLEVVFVNNIKPLIEKIAKDT